MPRRPRTEAEKAVLAARVAPAPGRQANHNRRARKRYATNEKRRTQR